MAAVNMVIATRLGSSTQNVSQSGSAGLMDGSSPVAWGRI
jgi:hypothetical protein